MISAFTDQSHRLSAGFPGTESAETHITLTATAEAASRCDHNAEVFQQIVKVFPGSITFRYTCPDIGRVVAAGNRHTQIR